MEGKKVRDWLADQCGGEGSTPPKIGKSIKKSILHEVIFKIYRRFNNHIAFDVVGFEIPTLRIASGKYIRIEWKACPLDHELRNYIGKSSHLTPNPFFRTFGIEAAEGLDKNQVLFFMLIKTTRKLTEKDIMDDFDFQSSRQDQTGMSDFIKRFLIY